MAVNKGKSSALSRIHRNFFDGAEILKRMSKAEKRALSKFGAYTRATARQSLKYRIKPSTPGNPPSVHKAGMRLRKNKKTGITKAKPYSPLKDFLYFSYEPKTHSVVIGPVLLSSSKSKAHPATETLEKSGPATITEHLKSGGVRKHVVHIEARPYMAPAFAKEIPKLPGLFRGSI
jgi:hypothetical protein